MQTGEWKILVIASESLYTDLLISSLVSAGSCIAVWTPDYPITSCEVSADSRCIVVSLAGKADLVTLVIVHQSLPDFEEVISEELSDLDGYGGLENMEAEFDVST